MEENEFGTAIDRYGREIHKGDTVVWTDPETKAPTIYDVYEEPTEEMVKLSNDFGECEALPEECSVLPNEQQIQELADDFTSKMMTLKFGKLFEETECVEDDYNLNWWWEFLNESFYNTIRSFSGVEKY